MKEEKTFEFETIEVMWTIKFSNNFYNQLIVSESACYGVCKHSERTIYINRELPKDRMLRTVRHEIAHAFLHDTQISGKESFDEEALCEFVGIYGDIICEIAFDATACLLGE